MRDQHIHFLIPVLAFGLAVLSQYSGVDIWLAQHFYDAQTQQWPYQDNWLTQTVIHRGGRDLIAVLVIMTLLVFCGSFIVTRWRHLRAGAGYLLAASMTGLLIVSQLKSHTHLYSPSDLRMFGGTLPHIRLFDHVVARSPVGYAFPAGHAAGGYMLMSVYFLLREQAHRYRYLFLAVAIGVGLIFGIAQQVRGAHMLSHDLTTFAICWLSSLIWVALLRKPAPQTELEEQDFQDSVLIQR